MEVYDATEKYPREEKYSLISQTSRSASSVIANIAEAHGRYYYADKVRVLYIARGEIQETRSHLSIALGRKYITQEKFNYLDNEYQGLYQGASSYINRLRSQKISKTI